MSRRRIVRAALAAVAVAALGACERVATSPETGAEGAEVFPTNLVTLEWQARARQLVGEHRMSALAGGRVYAALSVAQHRALRNVDESYSATGIKAVAGFGPGGRSRFEARRGAVAGASAQVLSFLFPAAAASLEQELLEQGGQGPGQVHPHFTRGVTTGRSVGNVMVQHLQGDGFTAPWTGTVPTGPGMWIPSALPPAGVMFGQVKPYYMTNNAQFRSAPPPAFNSPAFLTDLNEVITLTKNRTPEQLEFARYWDFPAGSPTPIGYWNGVAADYVAQHGLDELAATQVFSVMQAAVFDALVGCWDAKYHYWYLRPSHASPEVSLAFTVPNFPAYPSGHSCASASAGRVLSHFFPGRTAELDAWVADAGLSRILAGIHYRFDVTAGQQLGRSVAELALAKGAP